MNLSPRRTTSQILSRQFVLRAILPLLTLAAMNRVAGAQSAQAAYTVTTSNIASPSGIAADGSGNIFYVDAYDGGLKKSILGADGYKQIKTLGNQSFSVPQGVAVDGSGNVFIADYGNRAVKEILAAGGYTTVITLGSGLYDANGLAVDRYGNVFFADHSRGVVTEMLASSNYTTVTNLNIGTLSPYGVAVDRSGNVFVADFDHNTINEITAADGYKTIKTLGSGFSGPQGVAVDASGNVYVADTNNGAVKEIFAVGGYTTVQTLSSGLNSPTSVAVNGSGNVNVFVAGGDTTVNLKLLRVGATNFHSVNVKAVSTTTAIPFLITGTGYFGAPVVLTQGAAGLDFAYVSGGSTCTGTLAKGSTCTVHVTFTPQVSGARNGAVELVDTNGTVLATAYISGTGVGAQVTFQQPGQTPVTLGGVFTNPAGVAMDGSGNIFFADEGDDSVKEIVAAGGYTSVHTLGSGFSGPFGVAVDGAGNVFVADSGNNAIKEIIAAGGYTTVNTLGKGFYHPQGVAVDGSGNVFVADLGNSLVKEIVAAGGYTTVNSLSAFSAPVGVAVDASGHVFVADQGNSTVKEIVVAGDLTTVTTLGSGFSSPTGVAVDGSGNVFVADQGSNAVKEIVAAGGYATVNTVGSGFSRPLGVAVDGSGNVFVGDYLNQTVKELTFATPPSLTFPTGTAVGSADRSDGVRAVTVANIGNADLLLPAPATGTNASIAAGFTLSSSGTCPQLSLNSVSYILASGANCTFQIGFAPIGVGTNSGSLVLTDNNLNVTGSTQAIALSGTGIQGTPTITTSPMASAITYGQTLASSTLTGGVASTNGRFAFTSPATAPAAGTASYSITFTPTDTANYTTATTTVSVTTTKATTTITTSPMASAITYGQTLASSILTGGVASTAGSFAFTVPGTLPGAGTASYSVTFTPSDSTHYKTATITASVTTHKATPTLTALPTASAISYGQTLATSTLTGGAGTPPGSFAFTTPTTTPSLGTASYSVTFTPTDAVDYAQATANVSVTTNQATPTIVTLPAAYPILYGQTLASSTLTGGVASVQGSFAFTTATTVPSLGTASYPVTFTPTDAIRYTTMTTKVSVTVNAAPLAYSAPTEAVGTTSPTQTATVSIRANGTLNAINILLQGTPYLDFEFATGGTCTVGSSYTLGQTCSVKYTFRPSHPGQRLGGITLTASTNPLSVLGNSYLVGTGTGPQVTFPDTGVGSIVSSGISGNSSVAVDGSGNIFVADSDKNAVTEMVAAGGYTTVKTLGSGFDNPFGVAVDGSGNVFVADGAVIKEIVAVGGYTKVNTVGSGFSSPTGVAVDGSGNVFVADYGDGNGTCTGGVKKVLAASDYTTVISLGSGFCGPTGVAVDGSGNVFVADNGNNAVKEIVAVGGYTTVKTLGSGFSYPFGVAVDGSGNVFVADQGSNAVKEIVAAGGYATINTLGSGFSEPTSVAVDAGGNVFVANYGETVIKELTFATSPLVSFPTSTSVGSLDSTDGLQKVTVANTGNTALTLPAPTSGTNASISRGFNLDSTGTCAQLKTGDVPYQLAAGTSCTYQIGFTPTGGGMNGGSLVLTDNNLNVSGSMQTIALSGRGLAVAVTPTITTLPTASAITYGQTLASSTLTGGLASTPGHFAFTAPSTAPGVGTASYAVTFTPTNAANYTKTTTNVSVTTGKATPTFTTQPTASAITYGQTLASSTLTSGLASTPGSFAFTTPATIPGAGTASYAVTFTPTSASNYTNATTTVSVITNKASQTITFKVPVSSLTYGSATTRVLTATSGASGTPVLFTASGPATVNGSTLTLAGAGIVVVSANEAASTNYTAAPQVQQSILIQKASATLTGPTTQPVPVINQQSGAVPIAMAGQFSGAGILAPSGSIAYSILNSSSISVASGTLTIASGSVSVPVANTLAPGLYTVSTGYAGDTNYAAATTITTHLQVGMIQPIATITAPGSTLTYGAALGISATATYNNAKVAGIFSYSVTLSGGSAVGATAATVLPAGTYLLSANFTPTDAVTYKAATATSSLTVTKASVASISLTSSLNPTFVQNSTTLTATVSSSVSMPTGTVTFYDNTASVALASNVAIAGGIATLPINTLTVGTHSMTAIYSGDSNFLTATSSTVSELVLDFNLPISTTGGGTTSQTIQPGGTATFTFNLSPEGATTFPAAVNLSVSGLPPGATYTITPSVITKGSPATTVTLAITTPKLTAKLHTGESLTPLALALLLLPLSGKLRRKSVSLGRLTALLLVSGAAATVTLTGCGAGNGVFGQAQKTYIVTITGTSGALSRSTTVTLNVE